MYKQLNSIKEIENNDIIFKHSSTCPISANAKTEVDKIVEEKDVKIIIVQENRDLSNEIQEKMKIKHESPQLIIIKSGRIAAVLNHWHITEREINNILEKTY